MTVMSSKGNNNNKTKKRPKGYAKTPEMRYMTAAATLADRSDTQSSQQR